MSSYGPNPPTATSVDGTHKTFNNPTFVYSSNDVYADVFPWDVVTDGGGIQSLIPDQSELVKWTGFNMSVDPGRMISRIIVKIERRETSTHYTGANIKDLTLNLVIGGSVSGSNKASSTAWDTSDTVATYNYTPSEWGVTITPADVNSSNFGFAFSVKGDGGPVPYPSVPPNVAPTAYIDYVTIEIITITVQEEDEEMPDAKLNDVKTIGRQFLRPSTGEKYDPTGSPSYSIYEANTGATVATGTLAKCDSKTGFYLADVNITAAAGFEVDRTYVVLITATVDSVDQAWASTFCVRDHASDVWSFGTRTLSSFGTLVADIWANTTRTLTSFASLFSSQGVYPTAGASMDTLTVGEQIGLAAMGKIAKIEKISSTRTIKMYDLDGNLLFTGNYSESGNGDATYGRLA